MAERRSARTGTLCPLRPAAGGPVSAFGARAAAGGRRGGGGEGGTGAVGACGPLRSVPVGGERGGGVSAGGGGGGARGGAPHPPQDLPRLPGPLEGDAVDEEELGLAPQGG